MQEEKINLFFGSNKGINLFDHQRLILSNFSEYYWIY